MGVLWTLLSAKLALIVNQISLCLRLLFLSLTDTFPYLGWRVSVLGEGKEKKNKCSIRPPSVKIQCSMHVMTKVGCMSWNPVKVWLWAKCPKHASSQNPSMLSCPTRSPLLGNKMKCQKMRNSIRSDSSFFPYL